MPIISFIMGIYLFYKFWVMRNLVDKETIRLIKQVKTWWGSSQVNQRWDKRDKTEVYKSGKKKVGKKIKTMVPFGLLDELTDAEVHAYIMNEDTVKFFIKLRQLIGGDFKLPGMPDLTLKGRKKDFEMKPE